MATSDQHQSMGGRVREARVARRLTLREFARRIERAPSYVNDIEYDRRVPSEAVLRQICEVLDLDFDTMLASAGRLGGDAERYLKREPAAGVLLRRAYEQGLGENELKKLIKSAEQLGKKRPETPPEKQ